MGTRYACTGCTICTGYTIFTGCIICTGYTIFTDCIVCTGLFFTGCITWKNSSENFFFSDTQFARAAQAQ